MSACFQTRVSSRTNLAESYIGPDGVVSQSVQPEQPPLVQTETKLFAARYADLRQNSAAGLWEAAACVDRAAAFSPARGTIAALPQRINHAKFNASV
jgi:hypothetical protein